VYCTHVHKNKIKLKHNTSWKKRDPHYYSKSKKKSQNCELIINWLVAGVALVIDLTALADWSCPTTTMFIVTFSAPIFGFWLVFRGVE